MTGATARDMTLALLATRAAGATVCPSEVARALAKADGSEWREAMPSVHAAIDGLMADGAIHLSWKGNALPRRAGPYRIGKRA